jgi:hypothetical protein
MEARVELTGSVQAGRRHMVPEEAQQIQAVVDGIKEGPSAPPPVIVLRQAGCSSGG